MIQANELRIGNWVSFLSKTFQTHHGTIEDCYKAVLANAPYQYEPIPLTPEILIAAGFKHGVSKGITKFSDDIDEVKENGDTHYWDIDIKTTDFVNHHSISLVKWGRQEYFTFQLERGFYRQKIKYLHQLQNLYFALTGTELTIKL